MIKKVIAIICVFGLLAQALPSLYGTSGLIVMPTADSLRYKEYNVGFAYYNSQGGTQSYKYFSSLGTFNGVELGFIGDTSQEGVFINAKYYMLSDRSENPLAIAFGATNISSFSLTEMFLVVSKKMQSDISLHFGFTANVNNSAMTPQIMFGGECHAIQDVIILSELMGSGSDWTLNIGVRYFFSEGLVINGYWTDLMDNSSRQNNVLSVGLSFIEFL